ncbi:hypothetical protein ILYODFUR_029498 [Ilyodon furcidens]|uniref:Uncharacterized protein n=1 Tax=Ilyodon furcidens TaxID=33524 RepID=A0ABV0VI86_9TELE
MESLFLSSVSPPMASLLSVSFTLVTSATYSHTLTFCSSFPPPFLPVDTRAFHFVALALFYLIGVFTVPSIKLCKTHKKPKKMLDIRSSLTPNKRNNTSCFTKKQKCFTNHKDKAKNSTQFRKHSKAYNQTNFYDL